MGLTGTVKIWIDGQLAIEASHNNGTAQSAAFEMIGGRKTPIKVQFISNSDNPLLQLYWESMIQDRLTVPTAALYPDRY
ncbi:MAG: PA14 domain-containing protein [Hormoscilla sp.]